ncbi:helix-turn-helix domain-containing protein [Burkholderia sp. BE17]|uniref:helix-turn-helix domain-containing protein n=1 Tax=Burkholderia sp. BE17 TaxID=2656644 RepID=UPI00128E8E50|nr:helix-turn-helix domain-containing protein [Burkholderia sp. BE17]MPV71663.1 helix-turn-helix domain-containing protein [Burkholderia sp. BE17]
MIILVSGNSEIALCGAGQQFERIPIWRATKCLAFLDNVGRIDSVSLNSGVASPEYLAFDMPDGLAETSFEKWMLSRAVAGEPDTTGVLAFLREQESYRLVCFLLSEYPQLRSVAALAARYGVSESHFRRLGHQALGRSVKRELREWRAAWAVLDLIDGRDSLTKVAMNHGFASSSHFSREIKDLFGMPPRRFRTVCSGH